MNKKIVVENSEFEIFLSNKKIEKRISELGKKISEDYKDKSPILIGILKGSFIFMADLIRNIDVDLQVEFIRVSSYQGTESTGHVTNILGLTSDIENQDIIIVEDIVDTGLTLNRLIETFKLRCPKSISVVTLLLKPLAISYPLDINYVGFNIPDEFVIGYGLDYNEKARELPHIYKILQPIE